MRGEPYLAFSPSYQGACSLLLLYLRTVLVFSVLSVSLLNVFASCYCCYLVIIVVIVLLLLFFTQIVGTSSGKHTETPSRKQTWWSTFLPLRQNPPNMLKKKRWSMPCLFFLSVSVCLSVCLSVPLSLSFSLSL